MNKPLIDQSVDRFLCWGLPLSFYPDAGITFKPLSNDPSSWPTGTNLFMADQAKAMLTHVAEPLLARIAELEILSDNLKQQAQIHAMEARGANTTISEIYQVVSGSTGEPGNWHGAEPIRKRLAELEKDAARWIPVSERLPDGEDAWCLVYADGAMNCMGYSPHVGWENWAGSKSDPLFNINLADITHWMPLPAPPAMSKETTE